MLDKGGANRIIQGQVLVVPPFYEDIDDLYQESLLNSNFLFQDIFPHFQEHFLLSHVDGHQGRLIFVLFKIVQPH